MRCLHSCSIAEIRVLACSVAGAVDLYMEALCGPCMVDGTESGKSDHLASTAVESDAELTPEDRERGARLNSMSWDEIHKIGRQAYEERQRQERFAEIP